MTHYAVDLDGTLAEWTAWTEWNVIGPPVPAMARRVMNWLADGHRVTIFTARFPAGGGAETCRVSGEWFNARDLQLVIGDWTEQHVGTRLEATNIKHWDMDEFWDDRAVQVVPNTGRTLAEVTAEALRGAP